MTFRHNPARSILQTCQIGERDISWLTQPEIVGYKRFLHTPKNGQGSLEVPIGATPALIRGEGVVAATYGGKVTFYDEQFKTERWTQSVDGAVYASLLVNHETQTIIVCTVSGGIYCFSTAGDVVWHTSVGCQVFATPTINETVNTLTVAAFTSQLFVLDVNDGRLIHKHELPKPWHQEKGGIAAFRDPYASPISHESDSIVVCAEYVSRIDKDCNESWVVDLGASVRSSPAASIEHGVVVAAAVNGVCSFISLESGSLIGTVSLGAKVVTSPAISGKVLAIGTANGDAFGIDIESREILWRSPGNGPIDHSSFSVFGQSLFVATNSRGNAVALESETGKFLWETNQRLGLDRQNPAMDITPIVSPDGYMYCGSYSGFLYAFTFRDIVTP